jgi:hypothetical protein
MNKKDIRSLMEAYDEIASIELSPKVETENNGDVTADMGGHDEIPDHVNHQEELEDMEHEKIQMVETRLRSVIAHAHHACDAIKKGSIIEPWMQDLFTTAEEHIVKVANVLIYRHDID